MNKVKLGTLSAIVASLLVGCGSSSSSSDDTNSDLVETKTGYFIDSAVANVDYTTTSGVTGKTDRAGAFQYKEGDVVTLKIGNLVLGEAKPEDDGLITPKTLTKNEEEMVLLLRTLQTLDVDNNLSNGIIINPHVSNSLQSIDAKTLSTYNESSLITLIDQGDTPILDKDYDGQIDVNENDAKVHFESTLQAWENGERASVDDTHSDNGNSNGNGNGNGNRNGNSQNNNGNGEENGDGNCDNNSSEESHGDTFNLSDYPMSILTPALKDSLAHMGNEERLAYDVYQNLYNYHLETNQDEIKQLKNISEKSEIKHVGIVQELVQRYALGADDVTNVNTPVADRTVAFEDMPSGKYDIPAIQELYDALYAKGTVSRAEALMTGCMVEVTDIDDLDRYIILAEASKATDVVEAFKVLRDGSYNHYWAFDKGLKNIGVTNGCYVAGDSLLGENKEGIYPTNDNH